MTALVLLALLAAPTARAAASKTSLTVGEAFVVEVTVAGPAGATFELPKEAGNESVELREAPVTRGAVETSATAVLTLRPR